MLQFLHPLLLLGLLLIQFTLVRTAWSQPQIKIHCSIEKAFCQLHDSRIFFPNFLMISRLPEFESKCRIGQQSFCKLHNLIVSDLKNSTIRCQSRECKPSDFHSPGGKYSLTHNNEQEYELQYICFQPNCLKEGFKIVDKRGNECQFYFSRATIKLWTLIIINTKDNIKQKHVYQCQIPMGSEPFLNEIGCDKKR